MLYKRARKTIEKLMTISLSCRTIRLSLLALIVLVFNSCGNGGGSESGSGSGSNSNVAKLSWETPTTNADGTTLDDLAGFKIYFGTSSGNYTEMIEIRDPKKTDYTLENLALGTYYFVAIAYDTEGNESDFSNEVSKTIP